MSGVPPIAPTLAPLDVIMVTYENPQRCGLALKSMLSTWAYYPFTTIIVNNGVPGSIPPISPDSQAVIKVIQMTQNVGWEGGLKAGLEASTAPFVVFANDDIAFPRASVHWARQMLSLFHDPAVAAVGPTSNFVSGLQNMAQQPGFQIFPVTYLIGFFLMLRREALDAVGGVDLTLPGGDDIDLSIRLRKAGYRLLVRNDCFLYHEGETTGRRVQGDKWNSADMIETTNNALIQRHGLREWFETIYQQGKPMESSLTNQTDPETRACAAFAPEGKVLEMGCGGRLTVPHAVGVDQHEPGELTPWRQTSAASVVADVFRPMPMFDDEVADGIIARHVLEHAIDPALVLQEWRRLLKYGGRLIVAAPNEALVDGVPMDPTHLHGFTPDSMRTLAELVGYRQVAYTPNCGNNMSFVGVYEKA